jgi:hypothetical protein
MDVLIELARACKSPREGISSVIEAEFHLSSKVVPFFLKRPLEIGGGGSLNWTVLSNLPGSGASLIRDCERKEFG